MKTLRDAFRHYPRLAQGVDPASTRAFAGRFDYQPRPSLSALLRRTGPFYPPRDAYRFTNSDPSWPFTDEDARIFRQRYQGAVDAVALIAVEAVRAAVAGLVLSTPAGAVGLPAAAVDWVVQQATADLSNKIAEDLVANVPGTYGRCGGMAFSAYDFFQAGWPIPSTDAKPPSGPLRDFIWSRLLDSLDANAATVLEWSMTAQYLPLASRAASAALLSIPGGLLGGVPGWVIAAFVGGAVDVFGLGGPKALLGRTRDQWGRLKDILDGQAAWPVCLVYDGNFNPFDNHCVLATGYDESNPDRPLLFIWNNNLPISAFPLDGLVLNFDGDQLGVQGADSSQNDTIGILAYAYAPVTPPAALRPA